MRILFVAMSDSIHTARWISQIANQNWEIHVFPSMPASIHPELKNVTVHDGILKEKKAHQTARQQGLFTKLFQTSNTRIIRGLKKIRDSKKVSKLFPSPAARLKNLIQTLKPDIIHSLEFQHSGYLTLEARKMIKGKFPTWITTNWGSDIYLFGQLPEHKEKILEILAHCDYYTCECQRDVDLAQSYGYKGTLLPVIPIAGGLGLSEIHQFRQPGKTSQRKYILLKGYQTWAGRSITGIRALEMCSDLLRDYRIGIYLANEDVALRARLFSEKTGIPIDLYPHLSHNEMLALHGKSRLSIGLSISDGISTSFLEALAMGSFPIQSCTGCADEWIQDGVGGYLVPAEDTEMVAAAIRKALLDDNLVDQAAERNYQTVVERLDYSRLQNQVIQIYRDVFRSHVEMNK